MLFLSGLAGSAAALDSKKADYKVGDRLQQHSSAASQRSS